MATPYPPSLLRTMPDLASISRSFSQFASSNRSFQIIHTHPPSLAHLPTSTLHILDSSFNPPTLAHLRMCMSAIIDERMKTPLEKRGPQRLLLLLATKNADKPAAPAGFEHRLAMMGRLAEDLARNLKELYLLATGKGGWGEEEGGERVAREREAANEKVDDLVIDVGVTKEAMFVAKARAIEESGIYVSPDNDVAKMVEQVHLTGFDTLVRLVDLKYYPDQSLGSLKGLFGSHRVRVMMREPPPKVEQVGFVKELKGDEWAAKGWQREWCRKVELVEGSDDISSTKVRECLEDPRSRKDQEIPKWCSPGVLDHIMTEGLYSQRHSERIWERQTPGSP